VVAVDAAGDVIAAGTLCDAASGVLCKTVVTVVKIAGDDGHLLWRRAVPAWRVSSIALDAARNAVIAVSTDGPPGNDFGVFKLAAGTGEPVWETHVSGSDPGWEEAFGVTALPSDDVAA